MSRPCYPCPEPDPAGAAPDATRARPTSPRSRGAASLLLLLPLLLLLLLLLLPAPAGGAGPAECTGDRYQQAKRAATELVARRAWAEALEQLAIVYSLCPNPNVAYNIATVCRVAARLECAWDSYRRYLAAGDNPAAQGKARAELQAVEEELLRTRVLLLVRSAPAGAAVGLDGRWEPGAATPFERWIGPGSHELALRLEGHLPLTRTLELRAGERPVLELALEPERQQSAPPHAPAAGSAAAAPSTAAPAAVTAAAASAAAPPAAAPARARPAAAPDAAAQVPSGALLASPAPSPADGGRSWPHRTGWAGLSAGLALALAGGGFHLAALQAADEFAGIDRRQPQAAIDRQHAEIRQRVESREDVAWGLYAAGLAGAAAGGLLLWLAPAEPRSQAAAAGPALRPLLAAGGATGGVVLGGALGGEF